VGLSAVHSPRRRSKQQQQQQQYLQIRRMMEGFLQAGASFSRTSNQQFCFV
jgi:hypothetical protein